MTDTSKKFPNQTDAMLTTREGYEAMAIFLESFWVRDGLPDDSLALLLSFVAPVGDDRRPADPAMWGDWLSAIERARTG